MRRASEHECRDHSTSPATARNQSSAWFSVSSLACSAVKHGACRRPCATKETPAGPHRARAGEVTGSADRRAARIGCPLARSGRAADRMPAVAAQFDLVRLSFAVLAAVCAELTPLWSPCSYRPDGRTCCGVCHLEPPSAKEKLRSGTGCRAQLDKWTAQRPEAVCGVVRRHSRRGSLAASDLRAREGAGAAVKWPLFAHS